MEDRENRVENREDMITISTRAYNAITFKAMRYDMYREYIAHKQSPYLTDTERLILNIWEEEDNE